ncbi:hypothetical protein ABH935_007127 [Catenulispora sp. GAS73]|uniref:glycoside hydrolase domain-containing protein n=1 Tax=Catenulispora sp. GAS73 TaxID=3156269 RepID=UPI003515C3DB
MIRHGRRAAALAVLCAAFSATTIGGASATAASAPKDATQSVSYLGHQFTIPAGWPVVDLGKAPSTCVRFDQHAVYLGTPGTRQNCPAQVIGRTETLLVQPAAPSTAPDRTTENPVAREVDATGSGFQVSVTYNTDRALAQSILASAGLPAPTTTATTTPTVPATGAAAGRHPSAQVAASVVADTTDFTGQGFDACGAPDSSSMSAWKSSSPYSAVGIYIGGANRTCSQPNLTSAWVAQQASAGWRFAPIYVGLQGPGNSCGCATISSASQGIAAADDAINQATALGFPAGIEITYDMEAYGSSSTSLVVGFESDWAAELHAHGYKAGVYGSMSSTVADLVNNYSSYTMPDVLDFASIPGSGSNTVSDPGIPSGDWSNHQRIHQYTVGHDETWGGVTIGVDGDYFDVQVSSGSTPPVSVRGVTGHASVAAANGTLASFQIRADGNLYETNQTGPASGFTTWGKLSTAGGLVGAPSAVLSPGAGGTVSVFARTTDGHIAVFGQSGPQSGFSNGAWVGTGSQNFTGDPSVTLAANGTMIVFAVDNTGNLWESNQSALASGFGAWGKLSASGGLVGTPSAVLSPGAGGTVSVFARTTDGHIAVFGQSGPQSGFSNGAWVGTGSQNFTGDPSVTLAANGTMIVFAVDNTGNLFESNQSAPASGFGAWGSLSTAGGLVGTPSAVLSSGAGGTVSVFARTTNGHIAVFGQSGPQSGFSNGAWIGNNVSFAGDPSVSLAANGTMDVFASDGAKTTGTQYGINQTAIAGGFGNWWVTAAG